MNNRSDRFFEKIVNYFLLEIKRINRYLFLIEAKKNANSLML